VPDAGQTADAGDALSAAAKKLSGASFARGSSKQDYSTPRIFLDAVERRFGKLDFDLAATKENRVVEAYLGPDRAAPQHRDSLAFDWNTLNGNLWLNPPFDRIAPWAAKCSGTTKAGKRRIFFLVPAAAGSNWWRDFVHEKARVLFLNGRLSFDGKAPYPKDTALCIYGETSDYECWSWRV
jgi:phage N-6-adenine-methyltransferase